MKERDLFLGTMPFNVAKLVLGGTAVILSLMLFALLATIGSFFGEVTPGLMFWLWLIGTAIIYYIIMHYMGYLVKAGHIAVIAKAVAKGEIPENQVEYGKAVVKEKFATMELYYGLYRLVSSAVRQIQEAIKRLGEALELMPGVKSMGCVCVTLALKYIDTCCMGYVLYKKNQCAYKSAAEGVALYAGSWRTILKQAAAIALKVILANLIMIAVIFLPIAYSLKAFALNRIFALCLSVLITGVIKFAFIDSLVMIRVMTLYMSLAHKESTDLYGTLCNVSESFRVMVEASSEEGCEVGIDGL